MRTLLLLVRLAVFAGAVAFVLFQVNFGDRLVARADGSALVEPGVISLFARARLDWVALAFLSFLLFTLTGIARWWWLLRTQGLRLAPWEAVRLSYLGIFFNNVIPGVTGGDVVKAVYVARRVGAARTRAVTTIFVDRVMGLAALLVLGCAVALTSLANPVFRQAARLLIGLLAAGALAALPLFSRRLRRWLRLDLVLERLPFQRLLREVDAALHLYRHRPGAVGLIFLFSVGGQVFGLTDAWCMARALGLDLSLVPIMIVVPVIQVFCIVPITPGAWGVGEGLYVYFFRFVGVSGASALGISVGTRLIYTVQSLLGGLFLLHEPRELRAARRTARGTEPGRGARARP